MRLRITILITKGERVFVELFPFLLSFFCGRSRQKVLLAKRSKKYYLFNFLVDIELVYFAGVAFFFEWTLRHSEDNLCSAVVKHYQVIVCRVY